MNEQIAVRITNWRDPEGSALRSRQLEETLAIWPNEPIPPSSKEECPIVVILFNKKEESPTACGALQPLGDDTAEVKRVYVVPEYRGRDHGALADFLLLQLELQASKHGLATLKLETGGGMQRARAWYERNGFTQVPLFEPYIGMKSSVCYEKRLAIPFGYTVEDNKG